MPDELFINSNVGVITSICVFKQKNLIQIILRLISDTGKMMDFTRKKLAEEQIILINGKK